MARSEVVIAVDDVTGEVLDDCETVHWSLDGITYEFDTSPSGAAEFRALLAPYARVSRRSPIAAEAFTRTVTGRASAIVGCGERLRGAGAGRHP
ncbi:Lsr2 dimerization domain-containing protein [Gordonia sihwensis]|uniref:Lsr2 dimerization domain-containing protein n=1 Tax=Gordonia sihwensis TaxID=173559 RepID=UPI003D9A048D